MKRLMTDSAAQTQSSFFEKALMPGDLTGFLSGNGFTSDRVYYLTDSNVHTHCLNSLAHELDVKADHLLVINPGESSKDLEIVEELILKLAEAGCNRDCVLVNFGGGVVTDIGGFLASVYKRGIPYVNVPTSLLGMVDASIGSKTGVDAGSIKNIIGTINDPLAVMIDPSFLDSLPDAEWRNGLSEIIKHALIADKGLWQEISAIQSGEFSKDTRQKIKDLVPRASKVKHDIVVQDKHESAERLALNFGHTLGHAIESVSMRSSSPWPHGKAVAAGIIMELIISKHSDGFPEPDLRMVSGYLSNLHDLRAGIEKHADALLDMIRHDKKQRSEGLRFCYIPQIGEFRIGVLDDMDLISKAIEEYPRYV